MPTRTRKPFDRRQQNFYSQLECRRLLAADFSNDSVKSAELFTVEPTIDFMEVQWSDESRLATSGEWLIWQNDASNPLQPLNEIQVGDERFVEAPALNSAFAGNDQKLSVTEELASGLFMLSGADHWSYEFVVESVAEWIPNAVVQPNFIVNVSSVPNDSDFGDQWGLNNTGQNGGLIDADIDAVEAWDLSTGSSDVLIGVIDTGVDYTHPDLVNNIWVNPGEIADDGIDNDGNGFIDDVHGWNFLNNNNDPDDLDGHGTHVAGIIGAVGNNDLGVTGVSQNVSLVPIKFLASNGGTLANAVRSVEYANTLKQQGHNIVATNNSWGGDFDSALELVIEDALSLDILFVAAAGNDGGRSPEFPASIDLDNIISVAATDRNDQLASFSNRNSTTVDIAAPGEDIRSTYRNGSYHTLDGTSQATPHVTGALALLAATEPQLSALEMRDRLFERVDILPQLEGDVATSGRLNVHSLLDPDWVRESSVEFDKSTYLTPDTINLELFDSSGFAAGATVTISAASGDTETLAISATGNSTFSTSIQSVEGAANPSDGALQITSGDTLTVTYFDADYRLGQPLTATDSAQIFVDDFGNDATEATPVSFPMMVTGAIEVLDDEDWFSFEATAGVQYDFASNPFPGDLFWRTLSIYGDESSTPIDTESSPSVSLTWIAPSDGTFYVVLSENRSDTGTYELTGTETIPEATVSFNQELYSAPGTVQIDLTDPNGFTSGSTVTIEASSGDVETIAISTTGDLIFSALLNSVGGASNTNDGILQVTTGDTLTATYIDLDTGFVGTFTATDSSTILVDDHGDSAATATSISFPYDIIGSIEVEEDHDWFSFDAVAGKDYKFTSQDGSLSTRVLTLYDTDGITELESESGFDETIDWVAPNGGTYYISINDSGDDRAGTYEFSATESIPLTLVKFESANFEAPATVGIELVDPRGFTTGDTLTIQASTGDIETIAISAIGDLEFSTSINSIAGNANPNDGTLQIENGATLTATFFDAVDGFGGSYTVVDTAMIFVDDFGDDAGSANALELPFNVSGDIERSQDQDWFRFDAVAGMQYNLDLTQTSGFFGRLSLFDGDGVTELANNFSSNGTIAWIAPSDGTFYISVSSQGSTRTGTYDLSGSSVVPQGSVAFDAETLIAPGPINLTLTDPRGFTVGDSFTIAASSGDVETYGITATGQLEFLTSLTSVGGSPIPNDGILQVDSSDTLTATYFDTDDGFGGSYSVTETASILVDDHGNDSDSAALIDFPLDISVTTDFADDEDWFRFNAIAGMQYDFEGIRAGVTIPTLTLYDTDGTTEILSERDRNPSISWIAPSDGVYYVAIDHLFTSFGIYQLTGTESIPEATVAFASDSLLAPQTISIDLTDPTGFSANAVVTIASSSGDIETLTIANFEDHQETLFIDSVAGSAVAEDGVLQVADGDTLTATFFDPDNGFGGTLTTSDTAVIFVDDHGSNALAATPFEFPINIDGVVQVDGDEDWFSFTAVAGKRYEFDSSNATFFEQLTLYNLDGTTQLGTADGNGQSIVWIAPTTGTYFVSVKNRLTSIGSYQLNGVESVPEGTIGFAEDVYLAKNTIRLDLTDLRGFTDGDTITIASSSGDVETMAIPASGQLSFSQTINASPSTANANDGILQIASGDTLTATYFDSDDGFGGTISVTDTTLIFVDDHGDQASTATPVNFPFSVNGHREVVSDQDWFSFNATEGMLYEFEAPFNSGTLFWKRLNIFDVNGTTQLITDDGPAASLAWIAPSSGTYFLSISDRSMDSGTYILNGTSSIPEATVDFSEAIFLAPESVGLSLTDPTGFIAGDSVTIEASSGDIETIFITATGELDFSTSIEAVEGAAIPNDGILQITNDDTITATFLDSDNGFGSTFTATTTATILADDHGNNASTATPLTFPLNITGSIEEFGESDWFSFDAVAGTRYEFRSPIGAGRLSTTLLRLYDTDGTTEIGRGQGFDELISWVAPSDGVYFVSVIDFSGLRTGAYQLTTAAEPPFLLGDVNQDGVVNFLDISPFISLLVSADYLIEADIDGDGSSNFLDIAPFITLLSSRS